MTKRYKIEGELLSIDKYYCLHIRVESKELLQLLDKDSSTSGKPYYKNRNGFDVVKVQVPRFDNAKLYVYNDMVGQKVYAQATASVRESEGISYFNLTMASSLYRKN